MFGMIPWERLPSDIKAQIRREYKKDPTTKFYDAGDIEISLAGMHAEDAERERKKKLKEAHVGYHAYRSTRRR